MDIMELGAIGELVSGVAVIGSLLYVGIQVRQSNQIATNTAAQTFRQLNNEFIRELCSDASQFKLYLEGLSDRRSLSTEDRIRFDMMLMQMFRTAESQYLEYRDGHMSAEIWESYFRSLVIIMRQPGARASWNHLKEQMIARFASHIDDTVLAQVEA